MAASLAGFPNRVLRHRRRTIKQQHSLGPEKMIMVVIIIATDSIINM